MLVIRTIYNIFANSKPEGLPPSIHARMAESVDALVSNTSGAIRAGSIPALGTRKGLNKLESFFRVPTSQPQSAALTAPDRGIPPFAYASVGCHRCIDVLRTSR